MRKIYSLFIVLAIATGVNGQIAAWQFGSPASAGNEATYAATTLNANLTSSSLSRGAGITASALARGFAAANFTASGTKANAIATNQYYTFTINGQAGFNVSLSTLDVRLRRSSTGPNAYIWRYSTDGVNFTDIGSDISFTSTVDGVDQPQIDLSVIPALQNVPGGTTITFRLYAWGATATGGTFSIGRYAAAVTTNSLAIGGSVVSGVNPSLATTQSNLGFGSLPVGSFSTPSLTFNLSGANLTGFPGNITVNAPSTDFQVSNDDATWGASTTIGYTSATLSNTPVYVRFSPQSAGPKSGNITFTGGGVAVPPTVGLTGIGIQTYYSKATGNLTDVATWGINTDGTGASPADFTSDGQVFIIANRASVTLDANWTVSGSGAKVITGDGSGAIEFTIPAAAAFTGTIDVANAATLVLQNATLPTIGVLSSGSTVNYAQAGAFTVPQRTYHNLTLTGGTKILATGITTVNGSFTLDAVTGFNGSASPFSTLSLAGDFNMTNGAAFEPNGTGDANRMTLILTGSSAQLIQGGDLYLFRLQTPSTPATSLSITLAAANLFLGNLTSGGLNLQQNTHTLAMGANTITIQQFGFFSATNTGLLNGTSNASLVINKTGGSAIGTVSFAPGGEFLQNLTYSSTGAANNNLTLGSSLSIANDLTLTNGNIILGANNLTVSNAIVGGSATSYVVTNGAGTLTRPVASTAVTFPVGPSTTLYHPASLTNTGTADNFSVAVSSTDPPCAPAAASVNATWDITEGTPGGSVCDITLDYTGAATGGTYSAAGARIIHCNGVVSDYNNGSVTGTVATGSGFTSFSPFGITNDLSVLPIGLTIFQGNKGTDANNITWKASCSAAGTYTFELQRSNDARNFSAVTVITADEVRCQQPFAFADNNFNRNAVNYYRLKMTDVDGKITYSRIISLINKASGIVINGLMPTVTANTTVVVISAAKTETISLVVTDVNGRIVKQFSSRVAAGTNNIELSVTSLQAGVYMINAVSATEKTPAIRMIKQ